MDMCGDAVEWMDGCGMTRKKKKKVDGLGEGLDRSSKAAGSGG